MTYHDGIVFEGFWKEGHRSDRGKQTWSDGRVYEGDWKGLQKNMALARKHGLMEESTSVTGLTTSFMAVVYSAILMVPFIRVTS